MAEKLRKCPVCPDGIGTLWSVDQCNSVYAVCMNCGMRTRDYHTAEEAITVWNTRPAEERLREQLGRAMGLLEALEYEIFDKFDTHDECCDYCFHNAPAGCALPYDEMCKWRWQHATEYEQLKKEINDV